MQIPEFFNKKNNNDIMKKYVKKLKWACFKKASYF